MAVRSGDPVLYIAQKTGKVVAVRDGAVDPVPVFDLRSQVSLGGEQGLLGIAFSPDGRHMYVNYTDVNGDTRVAGYEMQAGRAAAATRRDVLFVEQPYSNHNGGNLVVRAGRVPLHRARRRRERRRSRTATASPCDAAGQDAADRSDALGDRPYGIPADNPFVGRADARPEIWAYGLRNPWRYSFDRPTGDLWIGDVGQSAWEEVDVQPADSPGGENYGWNRMEGDHPYGGAAPPARAVPPVYEYSHDDGVRRDRRIRIPGEAIPDLLGAYVFADFCGGEDRGSPGEGWPGDRASRPRSRRPEPQLVRRRRPGRALRDLPRWRGVPAGARRLSLW